MKPKNPKKPRPFAPRIRLCFPSSTPSETRRIDSIELPADVCTGRDAQLRLADFDRDGRVEVRVDMEYETDVSCGAQSERYSRLYVVDIADLVLQAQIVLSHEQGHYFTEDNRRARARFAPLNADEYPDIQVSGRSEHVSLEHPSRDAIDESWLYDLVSDSWSRPLED